jgi:hypothetical protein
MQHLIRRAGLMALLWWGLTALLVGGALWFVVLVALNGASITAAIWLPMLAGIYSLALVTIGSSYAKKRGLLIKMANQYEAVTTLAPTPPDLALALPPGQRVTVHFQRDLRRVLQPLLIFTFRMLVVTLVAEALNTFYTPDVFPTPLDAYIGVPLWIQWLVLLVPLGLLVLLCARQAFMLISASGQTLTVDDWGITRQRPGLPPQRLAWKDITGCVRTLFSTGDQALGAYMLFSPQGYIEVHFAPLATLSRGRGMAEYHFDPPAPAAYRALAERILATILARSGVPLRVLGGAYYSQGGRYSVYTLGMAAQDVAAQPEAPAPYQPLPETLAWAQSYAGSYSLPVEQDFLMSRSVITASQSARSLLSRAALLLLAGGIFLVLLVPLVNSLALLVIALILIIPGVVFIRLAWRQVRRRDVVIVAEAGGLRQYGASDPLFVPWREIQSWGVIPPSARQPDPVFAVLWSGQTLTWREPQGGVLPGATGNLHEAYVAASHVLHALITVRSGQPLRLIRDPAALYGVVAERSRQSARFIRGE